MENARRSQDRLHKTHTPGKTAWDCPRTDALLYSWWWPSTHRSVRSVWREIREIISGNMQIPREAERLGIFPVCVCTCRRRLKWQYSGKVRGRNSDCYWLDPCHLGECLILVWSPHTHILSVFLLVEPSLSVIITPSEVTGPSITSQLSFSMSQCSHPTQICLYSHNEVIMTTLCLLWCRNMKNYSRQNPWKRTC